VLGKQLERKRLQRIADEQRGRFVIFDVHGRLAAPQDVVVHARQVVVDERVGMDHLDCASGDLEAFGSGADQLARAEAKQRTDALAAFEGRVAHRIVEPAGRNAGRGQQPGERAFDPCLDGAHPGGKRNRGGQRTPPASFIFIGCRGGLRAA
jgi:hypothetical protein